MRDPRGNLAIEKGRVVRKLHDRLKSEDFLFQAVARELVRDGLLVDFEVPDDLQVTAPRVAWVSQPTEWCGAQLLDAAQLSLDVAERSLTAGFELKDASAWNVIFDGSVPVFCDHLSFQRICRREWRALGQFARHFILPLLVAARTGLQTHAQFSMFRDGITPQLARKICGWRMLFSRAAPLMLAASPGAARAPDPPLETASAISTTLHANLLRYCRFSLPSRARMQSRQESSARGSAREWSNYVQEREHYGASAIDLKLQQVRAWIERTAPSWVLDLGANTGEFSLLAVQGGARVIALDSDHDCMQRLYLHAHHHSAYASAIFPVIAQLDDLCAGRGWRGREVQGLDARLAGHCDLVMMLGLLHHLMIACAIPVAEVAEFAAILTREWLILETVSEHDPMFQTLAAQYDRTSDAARVCGQAAQLAAFARHFDIVDRSPLPGSNRTLLLLIKKVA
ncbi:MAG TPA: hypothetical protein VGO61_02165 [Steroidobacteraceae bacterium]|jgi:hypothetical protein|nr:hypothetical protein [Steroidobacteraceae bacterium]